MSDISTHTTIAMNATQAYIGMGTYDLNTSDVTASVTLFILFLITVFGVAGNLLICFCVLRSKSLRTPVNILVLNMAFVGLMTSVTCVPLQAGIVLYVALGLLFTHRETIFSMFIASHSIFIFLTSAQLLMLASISFERYQAIAKPFEKSKRSRRVRVNLAVAWFISMINLVCYDSTELCCRDEGAAYLDLVLHDNMFIVLAFLPFCFIVICVIIVLYCCIVHMIRAHIQVTNKKKNKVAPVHKTPLAGGSLTETKEVFATNSKNSDPSTTATTTTTVMDIVMPGTVSEDKRPAQTSNIKTVHDVEQLITDVFSQNDIPTFDETNDDVKLDASRAVPSVSTKVTQNVQVHTSLEAQKTGPMAELVHSNAGLVIVEHDDPNLNERAANVIDPGADGSNLSELSSISAKPDSNTNDMISSIRNVQDRTSSDNIGTSVTLVVHQNEHESQERSTAKDMSHLPNNTKVAGKSDDGLSSPANDITAATISKDAGPHTVDVCDVYGNVSKLETNDKAISGAICVMNPKNREQGKRRLEARTAKLAGLVIGVFMLLWLPCQLDMVYTYWENTMSDNRGNNQQISHDELVTQALAIVALLISPCVFALVSKDLRRELNNIAKRTIAKCK